MPAMSTITRYLPFAQGISSLQASTYLFHCVFSISFLVFLNGSISFVITDLLDIKSHVGDLVGTLGFADELVALVACPIWGIASDRLGVRWVCFLGYCIVGVSLMVLVQARNVYPQLLIARLGFSVGAAATATMVTAILSSMTGGQKVIHKGIGRARGGLSVPRAQRQSIMSTAPSTDSEVTITPERFLSTMDPVQNRDQNLNGDLDAGTPAQRTSSSPPRLAGWVGVFTGFGAILGLLFFLPLPARFSHLDGITQGQAVADSFYVVGGIALVVAAATLIGLQNLQGEEGKGWRLFLGRPKSAQGYLPFLDGNNVLIQNDHTPVTPFLPYWRLILDSTVLGFKDAQIGLGYVGGFVARASSVGISLFIPLYINAYFIRNGFCTGSPNDPSPELKKECRAAYLLSSELTGISQLVALLCAPAFGYISDRYRRFNVPLLVAAFFGVLGYTAFAQLRSPEVKDVDGRGGSPVVFLIVALIGISQIGAIVCSLGLLGRGVIGEGDDYKLQSQPNDDRTNTSIANGAAEAAPLLAGLPEGHGSEFRSHLKGSIAGVYSLSGGAAILILTKLGGALFDSLSPKAPFYLMALFNGVLLVVGIGSGIYREVRVRQDRV